MKDRFVIGLDYGSDSVRSVLLNAFTGEEKASSVFYYPRWKNGLYCNAVSNQFRQHPLDYLEGLESTIKDCLQKAGLDIASNVAGISVDTTGSTPVAADEHGVPLCPASIPIIPGITEPSTCPQIPLISFPFISAAGATIISHVEVPTMRLK